MSKTGKILILLIIAGFLIGGAFYLKSTRLPSDDLEAIPADDMAMRQALIEGGDEDISALLSLLDEEQTQETDLLLSEDSDSSLVAEENLLVSDINQLNQNEI